MSGQMNMFDMSQNVAKKEELYQMRQMKELPKKEVLLMEKEMLGLYVSGHPLDN
jgi:DNA polymerase-3 subunit alpha